MTMRSLNAHVEAYKMRKKMRDEEMWTMGLYVNRAVGVAIEHNFAKKANSKYYEKPLLSDVQDSETNGIPLTEEQLRIEREAYVKSLIARKERFNRTHRKEVEYED